VLPHEVTHTVFATHFRRPLPRWADEGACTTVEHASEKTKQQNMLISFLRTGRGIAFSRMFAMREYPHDVMPLYSQGYSVARFLVAQGGRRKFLDFLSDGMRDENWSRAVKQHYGFDDLRVLQDNWLAWVKQGSPQLDAGQETPPLVAVKAPAGKHPTPANTTLAAATGPGVYDVASTRETGLQPAAASKEPSWRPRGSAASAEAQTPPAKPAPVDSLVGPEHQVTRPQEFQRPRQVILEWSRPPGSDGSSSATPLPGPL